MGMLPISDFPRIRIFLGAVLNTIAGISMYEIWLVTNTQGLSSGKEIEFIFLKRMKVQIKNNVAQILHKKNTIFPLAGTGRKKAIIKKGSSKSIQMVNIRSP